MQSPAQPKNRLPMPIICATPASAPVRPYSRLFPLLAAAALISACARVPELEDRLTPDLRGADYPALVPLEDALQPRTPAAEESKALEDTLDARAARLQARADRLRAAQP
ncbi:hypothetical protein PhaeoP18_00777 [Phaeobacter piscinae]|uniref:Uncharacterized protein n=1 Tax=Phaeobacter piscinae TaxID=1580596 RepID=A0AAN1GPE8_9RHOB|nr:hypothetical protein [Phaeobacter piscinae]ATG42748.1 hypothetical protein PhaeoP13_00792 [Phaeobacter piscinae]AUQ75102.1 hypothetical protein PhaeoP71_02249 [Phaeobacter piscinae]AUR35066.1 hypothetical protein PhaeoP18_00777 [Phaeobacter piscinae]